MTVRVIRTTSKKPNILLVLALVKSDVICLVVTNAFLKEILEGWQISWDRLYVLQNYLEGQTSQMQQDNVQFGVWTKIMFFCFQGEFHEI